MFEFCVCWCFGCVGGFDVYCCVDVWCGVCCCCECCVKVIEFERFWCWVGVVCEWCDGVCVLCECVCGVCVCVVKWYVECGWCGCVEWFGWGLRRCVWTAAGRVGGMSVRFRVILIGFKMIFYNGMGFYVMWVGDVEVLNNFLYDRFWLSCFESVSRGSTISGDRSVVLKASVGDIFLLVLCVIEFRDCECEIVFWVMICGVLCVLFKFVGLRSCTRLDFSFTFMLSVRLGDNNLWSVVWWLLVFKWWCWWGILSGEFLYMLLNGLGMLMFNCLRFVVIGDMDLIFNFCFDVLM